MPRADAKLKNLPRETLDELWDLKYPADAEQKALGLVDLVLVISDQYGISIGKSALAEFYQWLDLQRRMWARESTVEQLKEIIAKDTSLTPEQVKAAGQRLFMADGILEKDVKTFGLAATLENDGVRLKQKDAEIELRRESLRVLKRRVALLEKKAEFADEVKKAAANSEGGITAEQMVEIERRLKMM